ARWPADAARGSNRRRMGRTLPAADGLRRADPLQSDDPGSGLCLGGALRPGVPASAAESRCVEDARTGGAPIAAAVARHGADPTFPARYLAQPVAKCILSARLGPAADRGLAAQRLISAGSALQHTISQLSRRPCVAKLPGGGDVPHQRGALA